MSNKSGEKRNLMLEKKEKNIYQKLLNEKGRFSLLASMLMLMIGTTGGVMVSMLIKNTSSISIMLIVILLVLYSLFYSCIFLLIERLILDFFFSEKALPMLFRRVIALFVLDLVLLWLTSNNNTAGLNLFARFWVLHSNLNFFFSFYLPIIIYIGVATYVEMQAAEVEKRSDLLDDL